MITIARGMAGAIAATIVAGIVTTTIGTATTTTIATTTVIATATTIATEIAKGGVVLLLPAPSPLRDACNSYLVLT